MEKIYFVYIGKKLPKYAISSLKLANKMSGLHPHLLASREIKKYIKEDIAEFTCLEDFYDKAVFANAEKNISSDRSFREGFWVKTLERLFVISQFAKSRQLEKILHCELDQLLFRIDELIVNLEKCTKRGIFVPFHTPDSAVASVLYVNDLNALDSLINNAINEGGSFKNEMELLARWSKSNSDMCISLPTMASVLIGKNIATSKKIFELSEDEIGGVVDAAQLGSWIFGIDPRNVPISQSPKTKFIDKPSIHLLTKDNLENINFKINLDHRLFAHTLNGKKIRIYNLHLHAKLHNYLEHNEKIHCIINNHFESTPVCLNYARKEQLLYQIEAATKLFFCKPKIILRIQSKLIRKVKKLLQEYFNNALDLVYQKLFELGKEEPKPIISSSPFISGDFFLSICDVAVLGNFKCPKNLRARKDLLFIETDLIENRQMLEYASNFKAIIAHNGDHALSKYAIEFLVDSGIKVYATNLKTNAPNIYTIPIGIENAHHRRNGSIHYFNPSHMSTLSLIKKQDVLVSFSVATNPEVRSPLVSELQEAGLANEKMSISEYRSKLANARYVVSPPGNGIDCHRTWEAFYHKTVPVVEKQHWYFENHDLPVLVVDKFQDFIELTEREKHGIYRDIIENKYYDAIYFDYWLRFIYEKTYLVD